MASIRTQTTRAGTTWQVRYRHAGRQSSRTFATARDARRWAQLLDQVGPDDATAMLATPTAQVCPSLADWLQHHLDHASGITTGTRHEYARVAARTWLPHLGTVPVDRITRDHVARWVRAETGVSAKTIANAHGLLSTVLASAVDAGHLTANPCRGVRLPRGERPEMVFLTRDDYSTLLEHIPAEWRPLVALLAGTGLRWSEATALTWADVDLTPGAPSVRVTKAWKRADGSGRAYELGPPKTARAVRTVTLPENVAADLTSRREHLAPARTALVFTAARGGMVRHQNWHPRVWLPAVRAAGLLPRPRIHDLRHTHASWLIAAGLPLPVIQRRLGHESITTTVDVYGHLDRRADAAAAAAVDRALAATPLVPDPAQPADQDRVGSQRLRLVQ